MTDTQTKKVDRIVQQVANCFNVFGGGRGDDGANPLAAMLKDKPPMFALGVDVRAVVEFVLKGAKR
jgi:hypothetical protein